MSGNLDKHEVEVHAGKPLVSKWAKSAPSQPQSQLRSSEQSKFKPTSQLTHVPLTSSSASETVEIGRNISSPNSKVKPSGGKLESKWANVKHSAPKATVQPAKVTSVDDKKKSQFPTRPSSSSKFTQASPPQNSKFYNGPRSASKQSEWTNQIVTSPRRSSFNNRTTVDTGNDDRTRIKVEQTKQFPKGAAGSRFNKPEASFPKKDRPRNTAEAKIPRNRYEHKYELGNPNKQEARSRNLESTEQSNTQEAGDVSLAAWEDLYDPNESWADAEADYY